jgi:D-lactate dehydrogenase
MRVAFFDLEPWQPEYLLAGLQRLGIAEQVQADFFEDHLTPDTATQYADYDGIVVFIWTKVSGAVIDALPNLRLILTMSTGYDHIDLQACRERGITVCNVPHYGENTVAEHTFALILSLSRKLHAAYFQGLRGEYRIRELRGFDLYGKTLGVIGAGNIGLHVIRIARGFGMRVLAYDLRPHPLLAEVLGFTYTDLDTLLAESDIVSLHVPALPQTHHLINRETLCKMKRGALLINTARGSVVDTEALLWALEEGILAGAGLDVIEGEEYITEESALLKMPLAEQTLKQVVQAHLLLRRDDVVFTPHIAFNSHEAVQRILDTTLANLKAFLEGQPQNTVGARFWLIHLKGNSLRLAGPIRFSGQNTNSALPTTRLASSKPQ